MIYIAVLFATRRRSIACTFALRLDAAAGGFSRGLLTQIVRNNGSLLSLVVPRDDGRGRRFIGQ